MLPQLLNYDWQASTASDIMQLRVAPLSSPIFHIDNRIVMDLELVNLEYA